MFFFCHSVLASFSKPQCNQMWISSQHHLAHTGLRTNYLVKPMIHRLPIISDSRKLRIRLTPVQNTQINLSIFDYFVVATKFCVDDSLRRCYASITRKRFGNNNVYTYHHQQQEEQEDQPHGLAWVFLLAGDNMKQIIVATHAGWFFCS